MKMLDVSTPKHPGAVALVDDDVFEEVSRFKWSAMPHRNGLRVRRYAKDGDGKWRIVLLHRFITQAPPGMAVDHVNGDALDNRLMILRLCTFRQNSWNQRKTRGSSQYKGVSFHRKSGKWMAYIKAGEKKTYLGLYPDEKHAALVYNYAALRLHGEFAKLNVVT